MIYIYIYIYIHIICPSVLVTSQSRCQGTALVQTSHRPALYLPQVNTEQAADPWTLIPIHSTTSIDLSCGC